MGWKISIKYNFIDAFKNVYTWKLVFKTIYKNIEFFVFNVLSSGVHII